jgi:hypothetical protein
MGSLNVGTLELRVIGTCQSFPDVSTYATHRTVSAESIDSCTRLVLTNAVRSRWT